MPPQKSRTERAYAAAHFGLELGSGSDKDVGLVRSIEGGGVSAEVMTYQFGENYDVWRQLGKPKYEDIKVQVGMAASEGFYTWMSEFFNGKGTRKSGAIVAADFWYKERARRKFEEALITEIAIPKFDGSDKNAAYMNVTMAPEKIVFVKGDNSDLKYDFDPQHQKLWTSCNFALTIDGFGDKLSRVTKIDGFTIKQKVVDYHTGERREPIKVPSRVEFPNVSFYVPEVDAEPLINEFMEHADGGKPHVAGKNNQGLTGEISSHDNGKTVLITIQLFGLHLKSATPDKSDTGSEEIKLVKFEMAVERMTFNHFEPE
jgi:T4-like virus tail tube protein gp19